MTRYFTRLAWDDGVDYSEPSAVGALTVYEPEESYRDTGLLDESGERIYATSRVRLGFVLKC